MLSTTDHALSAIRDAREHFQRPHTMENVMGSIMEVQRQSIEFKRISLCLCGEAFHWEIQNQSLVHAHAGKHGSMACSKPWHPDATISGIALSGTRT